MKNNFPYILSLFAAIIFYSCEKNEYKALSGTVTLSGYVYLVDSLNNLPPVALGAQKIYLNTGEDTSSYILQTITDSSGLFSVPSLRDDKPYIIFTRFSKNGAEYAGALKIQGNAANHTIHANLNVYRTNTNGLSIQFADPNGGSLASLPFRLYMSYTMAFNDSIKFAFADTSSNPTGSYTRYNLAAGKYYIVARQVSGLDTLNVFDSVEVTASGVSKKQVIGTRVTTHYNGLSILFQDTSGAPIENLPFRLYTSYTMANVDSVSYAFASSVSTASGIYTQYNVPAGTYYIVVNRVIGADTMKVFDSIIVQPLGLAAKTVTVTLHPTHYNGMALLFTDAAGGPISRLPFRIYTSSLVASVDSINFAFKVASASENGDYTQFNMDPATYYIVAKEIVGSDTLKLFGSLEVHALGITKDTLVLH